MEKGFSQKEDIDYEETFSPAAKWDTICTLFSLAAQNICEDYFLEWRLEIKCLHVSTVGCGA
jgi:hypothetical protein